MSGGGPAGPDPRLRLDWDRGRERDLPADLVGRALGALLDRLPGPPPALPCLHARTARRAAAIVREFGLAYDGRRL